MSTRPMKQYNGVSLEACLSLGFSNRVAEMILKWVTIVTLSTRVNGSLSDPIFQKRSLSQGDLLLCGEALNRYLYDKERRKKISFPKFAPGGDRVGPLLFADDILIFFSNNDTSTNSVNGILDEFELEVCYLRALLGTEFRESKKSLTLQNATYILSI